MRKIYVRILAVLALCCTALTGCSTTVSKEDEIPRSYAGFVFEGAEELEYLNARRVNYVHEKTGAHASFVLNDDQERTFCVSFKTTSKDDKGEAHILEHTVLSSSENFPAMALYRILMGNAYSTYVNGFTSSGATAFPVSSQDKDSLLLLSKIYLDAVFCPSIVSDKRYFEREGWRYSLPSADADLALTGTVYNEMKGSLSQMNRAMFSAMKKGLFPDSWQQYESGGIPEAILTLTYEELVTFYKEHYTPENCYCLIYGDVDIEPFLTLMDSYFSATSDRTCVSDTSQQKPFETKRSQDILLPAAKDSSASGKIWYSFVMPKDLSDAEDQALSLLLQYFQVNEDCRDMLYQSGIGSSYSTDTSFFGEEQVVSFVCEDADTSRAKEFQTLVDSLLVEGVRSGVDDEMIRALASQNLFAIKLFRNQKNTGASVAEMFVYSIASEREYFMNQGPVLEQGRDIIINEGIADLVSRAFLTNNHALLSTITPALGMLEEQEQKTALALQQQKAAMSRDEIEEMVKATAEMNAWLKSSENQETLAKIRKLDSGEKDYTVKALPERMKMVGKVREVDLTLESNLSECLILYDVSHLSLDELSLLSLYPYIAGLSSDIHSSDELYTLAATYVNEFSMFVVPMHVGGVVHPYLGVQFYMDDGDVAKAMEIAKEMIYHSDIQGNADYLAYGIASTLESYKDPEILFGDYMKLWAESGTDLEAAYEWYLSGTPYIEFLKDSVSRLETDKEGFCAELKAVLAKALVRDGTVKIRIGSASRREAIQSQLDFLLPDRQSAEGKGESLQLLGHPRHLYVAANTPQQYVRLGVSSRDGKVKISGIDLLTAQVFSHHYAIPEFREQGGAYSTRSIVEFPGDYYFYLYSSPTFADKLKRYQAIPEEMTTLDLSASDLESFKVAALGTLLRSAGDFNDAMAQADCCLRGWDYGTLRRSWVEEIRSATLKDLHKGAENLSLLNKNAGYVVVAAPDKVKGHEALFEETLSL